MVEASSRSWATCTRMGRHASTATSTRRATATGRPARPAAQPRTGATTPPQDSRLTTRRPTAGPARPEAVLGTPAGPPPPPPAPGERKEGGEGKRGEHRG